MSLPRRNLQLTALRAFEAAARHGSFSKAADELTVTHAAVSHQIRGLEDRLGRQLFVRTNRGVTLTEAGETLLPVLSGAFDCMAEALGTLSSQGVGGALQVTTTPAFASSWLIPRLGQAHEKFDIQLQPTLEFVDVGGGAADVAIRCGVPPWDGIDAELLVPIHMTPVCSPAFIRAHGRLSVPDDSLGLPLLHADAGAHPLGEEWRLWLAACGVVPARPLGGQSFRDPGLGIQAALNGLGISMGYIELVEPELAAGRLVRPFDVAVRHPYSYYLATSSQGRADARIEEFRRWIRSEAGIA